MAKRTHLILFSVLNIILISNCSYAYSIKSPARVVISADRSIEDGYIVEIKSSGETRQLRLTPLESIWSDVAQFLHITRDENGEQVFERKNIPNNLKVYHDPEVGSVLSMKDGKLNGIVDSNYAIKHEDDQHFMVKSDREDRDETDCLLEPDDISTMLHDLHLKEEGNDLAETETILLENEVYYRQANAYTPEVAVIVDSKLASLIGTDSQIYEYLTIFWNGVKKRYQTIQSPTITIRLVGSIIIRDSEDEPFITDNLIYDDYIWGSATLYDQSTWVYSQLATLPDHDIMYLQTGRNLVKSDNTTSLSGIAYVSGACKKYQTNSRSIAVSLGEDMKAYFYGVHTAAHEIAHSLGAYHDDDSAHGTGGCDYSDGYIMSNVSGYKNRLFFSNCSIDLMASYMVTSTAACVTVNITETKPPGVYTSTSLPGDSLSMTEQCRFNTGRSQAEVYSKVNPEDSLCYNLKCRYYENGSYWIRTTNHEAAEGSQCPSGKHCSDGVCI